MSEKPFNTTTLTENILRRDRRRMWLLGSACIIAWMAVVMIPWATTMPLLAKVVQHQIDANSNSPTLTAEQKDESLQFFQSVKAATIATFLCSVFCMLIAAITTVLLVTLSRRATLRQLNARLRELSEQIKTLPGKGT